LGIYSACTNYDACFSDGIPKARVEATLQRFHHRWAALLASSDVTNLRALFKDTAVKFDELGVGAK
jgi:hypothetical protein